MKPNSDSHMTDYLTKCAEVLTGVPWPKQKPHIYIGGATRSQKTGSGSSSVLLSSTTPGPTPLAYWPWFSCTMVTLALPHLC